MKDGTFAAAAPLTESTRQAEVPGAPWADGCNAGGTNAPGIGVNIDGGAIEERPESWTLLDQDLAARNPQVTAVIGNVGLTTAVQYPSSGGAEGKGTISLQGGQPTDNSGDGQTTSTGEAHIDTLAAGWLSN